MISITEQFSTFRGSGRTTTRMKSCVPGSLFIVLSYQTIPYAKNLAAFINRGDLVVKSVEWLLNGHHAGLSYPGIVLDHDINGYEPRIYAELMKISSRTGRA
jgi:hypothetical protein